MEGYVYVDMDQKLRNLLNTIFTDEFMEENTNFSNFEGFQYSSAVITNWKADKMVYAQLLMDNFVRNGTGSGRTKIRCCSNRVIHKYYRKVYYFLYIKCPAGWRGIIIAVNAVNDALSSRFHRGG